MGMAGFDESEERKQKNQRTDLVFFPHAIGRDGDEQDSLAGEDADEPEVSVPQHREGNRDRQNRPQNARAPLLFSRAIKRNRANAHDYEGEVVNLHGKRG
jgi:hypothetical protein